MKKTLLSILSLFVATIAMAQTEYTWTWEQWDGVTKTGEDKNGKPTTKGAATITFTKDAFSIVANKGEGFTDPTVHGILNDVRIYAKSTFTVKNGKNMTGLLFNISDQGKRRLTDITASTGKVEVNPTTWLVAWTGDAAEVTFTVGDKATYGTDGNSKAGQFDYDKIAVYTDGATPSTGEVVDITNTPETAYTVAKAIELITAGKGLEKEVYVKGTIVNIEEVDIAQYGNATYNIADAGTTTPLLKIYRGFYFLGDKFTNANQIQDGDEVVVFGKLKKYGEVNEMDKGNKIYSLNGKTAEEVEDPYTLVGDGTLAKAYTAADVEYLFKHGKAPAEKVWVKGAILGNVNTKTGNTEIPTVFTDVNGDGVIDSKDAGEGEIAVSNSNISLGDSEKHVSVQLATGTKARAEINLLDHKENIGKNLWVFGKIEKYCGIPGVKDVSEFSWDGVVTGITTIATETTDGVLYNVAGQRVSDSFKGIIIKNGRKYIK